MKVCPNPESEYYDYPEQEEEHFFDKQGNPAVPRLVKEKVADCPDSDVVVPSCPAITIICEEYPPEGYIVRGVFCEEDRCASVVCRYGEGGEECRLVEDTDDLEELAEDWSLPQGVVDKAAELLGLFEVTYV